MNYEISQSFWSDKRDIYPDKYTISKMPYYEQWKYIVKEIENGNVIVYRTNVTSRIYYHNGATIVIYYDKNTDAYTECHPWTGSLWRDITKEEFLKYGL